MGYKTFRNIAIGLKMIGLIILLIGLPSSGAYIGAGIYNHEDETLGGGIQSLAIIIGIAIGSLIIGSIFDKTADDVRTEQLIERLESYKGHRR